MWSCGSSVASARCRAQRTTPYAQRALLVSAVSFAEIGVKAALGKLVVPDDLVEVLLVSGVRFLPLSAEHGLGVARLPMHHRDRFDRRLISQAKAEDSRLVTADTRNHDVRGGYILALSPYSVRLRMPATHSTVNSAHQKRVKSTVPIPAAGSGMGRLLISNRGAAGPPAPRF